MPTRLPHRASASARFTDTVVANTTLAGADGDNVLHPRQRSASGLRCGHRSHAGGHLDGDFGDAWERANGGGRLVPELVLDRTRRRRELDGERDPSLVDRHVLDEAKRDDVPPQVGIDDDFERAEDAITIRYDSHRQSTYLIALSERGTPADLEQLPSLSVNRMQRAGTPSPSRTENE